MKILAIEFSSEQRSVAIAVDGVVRASAMEVATRATHAFALIERALAEAGMQREEIECIAIGIGPGSYTGIRAAIALGQGWQMARGIKLLGIASVECLAKAAQGQERHGAVNIIIDAQRNEFYLARYDISENDCREVAALKLASRDEVLGHSANGEVLIGPDINRWFPQGKAIFPNAATLAIIASERRDFMAGEKLEPIYLRETTFVKAAPARILPTA